MKSLGGLLVYGCAVDCASLSCVSSFIAGTHTPRLGVLWEEGILKSGRGEEAALHLLLSPGCSYVRAFASFKQKPVRNNTGQDRLMWAHSFRRLRFALQEAPQSSSGHSSRSERQHLCTVGWPRSQRPVTSELLLPARCQRL